MIHSKKINLKPDNKNIILKKDREIICKINSSDININNLHKLFISCEDAMAHLPYAKKGYMVKPYVRTFSVQRFYRILTLAQLRAIAQILFIIHFLCTL